MKVRQWMPLKLIIQVAYNESHSIALLSLSIRLANSPTATAQAQAAL